MAITFDAAALITAAGRLSGDAQPHAPAVAEPPGVDMTSVSAVSQLNGASAALAALLTHGSAVREVGALALSGTAATLSGQDEANAAGISSSTGPSSVSAPAPLPSIPAPSVPSIPTVPAALAPLPGEAHSHALYGGPGSSSLHSFAEQWERSAALLRQTAASTTQAGDEIDANWEDSKQRAGANTRRHGEWLSHMSEQADTLANHARSVAQNFETAKQSTPSPQEFTQARQDLAQAMRRFQASGGVNAVEVQQKTENLARKQAEATAAAADYHCSVSSSTLSAMGDTIKTAPPIAGGGDGDGEVQSAGWKPGDKRHYPIVRGPGGLGPAQPPDGPGWVEIGPRSGNFVRPDELPGLKILNPGDLGPAPFYDRSGGEHRYVELVPGSGAWVPDTTLSDAQIKAPGALGPYGSEEYLPGSGIWMPREDLIPDPRDPTPPNYGQTVPAGFTQSTGFATSLGDGWDDDPVTEAEQIAPPGWSQDYHGNWSPPVITPGGAMGGGGGGRAPI
ncbi:PPE domain-containing protein [Mycolicibacterium frederiksbergense]|uniref:PPE domain-containing protein n=1 Tax=Mycolicibacterium frederiksbergense TaxID=117567 RepID=A0A6H0RY92_9MYCO|nr:PPE domain-containing protein [Mycolicibacterium frederiksbergense]QIV79904.1 PPE domain-containing protein [Mycolicibacterium frederiksbergense]